MATPALCAAKGEVMRHAECVFLCGSNEAREMDAVITKMRSHCI